MLANKYENKSFCLDGISIGSPMTPTLLDPQKGFNGQLVSKTLATYLAAVLDTAKDPVSVMFNFNTFTGRFALTMARMGFDSEIINYFLSQPIIMKLTDMYFMNSIDYRISVTSLVSMLLNELNIQEYVLKDLSDLKDPETLSRESLWKHMNDDNFATDKEQQKFQLSVLKAFVMLDKISTDVGKITLITKLNSSSQTKGSTLADKINVRDKIEAFLGNVNDTVFYQPTPDQSQLFEDSNGTEGYSNPEDILENEPILDAFYEAGFGPNSATAKIFSLFFNHFNDGFQNILIELKEAQLDTDAVDPKLYNIILNDYMYYLLTYQNKGFDIKPAIPYSAEDRRNLVSENGVVKEYKDALSMPAVTDNPIVKQSLEDCSLRIRKADDFINMDTLMLYGQTDTDGKDKLRMAWNSLVTAKAMDKDIYRFTTQYNDITKNIVNNLQHVSISENDAKYLRNLGIDLFFYTLMVNGFNYSPKTLMAFATVLVKANATYKKGFANYIDAFRKIRQADSILFNGINGFDAIANFILQCVQNHSDNYQLVPYITHSKLKPVELPNGNIQFSISSKKKYLFGKIATKNGARRFITTNPPAGNYRKEDFSHKELYMLVKTNLNDKYADNYYAEYKKIDRLGVYRNFIEYDANNEKLTSIFTNNDSPAKSSIKGRAALEEEEYNEEADDAEDNTKAPEASQQPGEDEEESEDNEITDDDDADENPFTNPNGDKYKLYEALSKIEGRTKTDKKYRKSLTNTIVNEKGSNQMLSMAFDGLIDPDVSMDEKVQVIKYLENANIC